MAWLWMRQAFRRSAGVKDRDEAERDVKASSRLFGQLVETGYAG
jgi:hypothetical protein